MSDIVAIVAREAGRIIEFIIRAFIHTCFRSLWAA